MSQSHATPTASPTVLVVDDDPRNRKLLCRLLATHGIDSRVVEDGEAALASIARHRPDLVVLDCMMPGLDGFEVCRRLKSTPELAGIPVVLVTALGASHEARGLEVGADDFVAKPIDRDSFLARIRTHLRLKGLRDDLQRSHRSLIEQNQQLAAIGQDHLALVETFVHDLRSPLNGLEICVDMLRAAEAVRTGETDPTTVDNIAACSARIASIVRMMDDWPRLEPGAESARVQPAMAADLVAVAVRGLAPAGRGKGPIPTAIAAELPVLWLDPDRVGRVIEQLLSRAVQVSDGTDGVSLAIDRTGDGILVRVCDSGPTADVNADGPQRRRRGNLGLRYCARALAALGGRMWVEPGPAGGNSWCVELPNALVEPVVEAAEPLAAAG